VVTSPGPQEGKTVTVVNLGLSFAMLPDLKILVVDGDLRKGSLGKWLRAGEQPLRVGEQPGLSNLLDGSAKLEDVVLKSDDGPLHFLVRGTSSTAPAELLHSMDLRKHFQRMGELFDLVLVDSPPVNLITDTQLLAASCDAVLLIARAFQTTRKAFEKATQDLAPFRVIGTVLNGGTKTQPYRKYGGSYY
jgi:capsular exopolysaccharide synthesis family protein